MNESIANITPHMAPPIADIHAIQAERFEREAEERRPISLEEMRDLALFFGNRGITFGREAE